MLFRSSATDISDGVDVVYAGLIIISCDYFTVGGNLHAKGFEVKAFCICRAANCEEDCIELILDLVLALLEDDYLLSLGVLADADRNCLLDEFHPLVLHVLSDLVGYLLVEASQKN